MTVQDPEKKLLVAMSAITLAYLFTGQLPQPWLAISWGVEIVSMLIAMGWYSRQRLIPSMVQAGQPDHANVFPERIGDYHILRRIAKTNSSNVYLAQHADYLIRRGEEIRQTDEAAGLFAIKVLREPNALQLKRLRAEAELSHQLEDDPRVVKVIEVFEIDDRPNEDPWFGTRMRYVDGEDLKSCVQRGGPLKEPDVIAILCELCESLRGIHSRGLVHRDVKPSNLIWTDDKTICLLDLGLVLPEGTAADFGETTISGTPAYMSPEAASRKHVATTSDIYSMGCVAYFLATGSPPFRSNNPIETLRKQIHERPDSTKLNERVSSSLAEIMLACLSKSPQSRPRSVDALRGRLASLASASR